MSNSNNIEFILGNKYDDICKGLIKNIMHARSDLDKPFVVYPHLKKTFTRRELADEIKNQSAIGVEMVSKILALSIDLFSRNKENLDGIETV